MAFVTIDEEQLQELAKTNGPVEVRGPDGAVLGTLSTFLPAGLMEQVERSRNDPRPPVPAEEVRRRLGLKPLR